MSITCFTIILRFLSCKYYSTYLYNLSIKKSNFAILNIIGYGIIIYNLNYRSFFDNICTIVNLFYFFKPSFNFFPTM